MAINFVFGQAMNSGKSYFAWGKKAPRNVCSIHFFLTHEFHFLKQWELAGGVCFTFFCIFPSFFHGWKFVFVLHSGWEEEIHDLGVYRGHLCSCKAHKCFLKSNLLSQGWFPHLPFRFWLPTTFETNGNPILGIPQPKHFSSYPALVFCFYVHHCFGLNCK